MPGARTGIGSPEISDPCTPPPEAAAKERLVEFTATWGQQYPAIIRLWENAWSEFVPFLENDRLDADGIGEDPRGHRMNAK